MINQLFYLIYGIKVCIFDKLNVLFDLSKQRIFALSVDIHGIRMWTSPNAVRLSSDWYIREKN